MLSPEHRDALLRVASASIEHGLDQGVPLPIDPEDHAEPLRATRACFVTLKRHARLRGCIGHLQAIQPLVRDVAENAFKAAFRDPRFPPLSRVELAGLDLHISILTPAEPMTFRSQRDLLTQIRPGIDGLILEEGTHRGTFLPSVWESLPQPETFLRELLQKAGLRPDYWSDGIRVYRYATESFP